MSNYTMDYSIDYNLPIMIERARDQVLSVRIYKNSSTAQVLSATISIFDENGTAIVDEESASISAYIPSYSLTSAEIPATMTLSDKLQIRWTVTIDDGSNPDQVMIFTQQAYLVRTILFSVVSNADVLSRHPDLAYQLPSGTSTWDSFIDEAWQSINTRLIGLGRRPQLILNNYALYEPHILLSLALIYRSLAINTVSSSRFGELATLYKKEYEETFKSLVLDYDADQNGLISEPEQRIATRPIVLLY